MGSEYLPCGAKAGGSLRSMSVIMRSGMNAETKFGSIDSQLGGSAFPKSHAHPRPPDEHLVGPELRMSALPGVDCAAHRAQRAVLLPAGTPIHGDAGDQGRPGIVAQLGQHPAQMTVHVGRRAHRQQVADLAPGGLPR